MEEERRLVGASQRCPLVWDKMGIGGMLARCDLADNPLDVFMAMHVDTRANLVALHAMDFHVSHLHMVPILCVQEEVQLGEPVVKTIGLLLELETDIGELDRGYTTRKWPHRRIQKPR